VTLAGKGAVVTGGGRGIGETVARTLAAAGASVVVAARTKAEIERVVDSLRASGAHAWAVECDVTSEESVHALAASAEARLGAVDVLVNNAGGADSAPLAKLTLAEWNAVLALNATSVFLGTRAFFPGMAGRGYGRIINIASIAGLEGAKYVAHYAAAKHAVVGFTRSVALELAGSGVTINAVCPGYVDTPMTARTIDNVRARTGMTQENALAAVLATAGQTRLVPATDVAAAVLALVLDAGANGQVVPITGAEAVR
jgi:NAD(P)-dependent dehydrogenase (short-subunit alcohol dehydrogenase family)